MTALPQDAALKRVAAWAMPDWEWSGFSGSAHEVEKQQLWFIHAAEQVAVERGHGERLAKLLWIVGCERHLTAPVAFAPLEARAMALHRLVCELEDNPDAEA